MTSSDTISRSAASSSSASKSSTRKRGRPTKNNTASRWKSPFTDFGSYMVEKNRKLRDQFDASASASTSSFGSGRDSADGKGIFHGVSIFVDGFTIPSSQELKGYMLKHGGRFENYFSRQHVTHIICSNLPDSKMRNLRSFSRGLPVVKPAWVIDSVAANKLLSWVPYQLECFAHGTSKQQSLSSFFIPQSSVSLKHADTDSLEDPHLQSEAADLTSEKEELEHLLLSDESNISQYKGEESEGEMIDSKPTDRGDHNSIMKAFESSPDNTTSSSHLDIKTSKEVLDTKSPRVSYSRHSTSSDPDFVKNYFKNSRLHFIGTWRNRYRKHFSNMLNGNKHQKTSVSLHASKKPAIIHIDMDCFFVSVIIRNYPELLDKPVAVCHSDNPKGTAEISSANYPARDYGVRAGMFVRDAKARCPHLVIFPYDFEAYQEVADQFYSILHKHCSRVQALSCDEAFLDVTECCNNDPEQVAMIIRKEISETTKCTASAGIAGNLLLARLATKSAKPNGQYYIPFEKVDGYLKELPVGALPGIGHTLGEKLKSRQIQTCGQLKMISKEALHKDFGAKIGDLLWNYSRGVDNRIVEGVQEMKSVGAEVNWGVRFNDDMDCHRFLVSLCEEVSLRLQGCGVQGRTIVIKVKRRRKGAEEPSKFMGCGDCESLSRSTTLPVATDDMHVLQRIAKQLFASFNLDVKEVRGVGLQVSRLENVDSAGQGREGNALESWLASASVKTREECQKLVRQDMKRDIGVVLLPGGDPQESSQDDANETDSSNLAEGFHHGFRHSEHRPSSLPPLCQLDVEVIKSLPLEILSEMNDFYNGKLCDYLEKQKGKNSATEPSLSTESIPRVDETVSSSNNNRVGSGIDQNVTPRETDSAELHSGGRSLIRKIVSSASTLLDTPSKSKVLTKGKSPSELSIAENSKVAEGISHQIHSIPFTCSRSDDQPLVSNAHAHQNDVMPVSLSQADFTVLQQLPEDLKFDIFELLPAHRVVNPSVVSTSTINEFSDSKNIKNDEDFKVHLWVGNPPKWVEKFKSSDCLFLSSIANMYSTSAGTGLLSTALQSLFSFWLILFNSNLNQWDDSLSSFCELLKQYIDLKIESDIEELYVCFRLLKRLAAISKFFVEVYATVLPFLQISVSENYGGEFQLSIDDKLFHTR
ncbi:hypothetical protein J5N97_026610 [Dioscorea zingiberensis]|uniref:DNA repair protein REV1 n=1 Tax=Dioscorea zingiberensis TaxID=325984 RepID=A0A9D5C3U1_9LILI|nr:hypothetical protein J5N97_026610 [Dioscorea zingiberensis]